MLHLAQGSKPATARDLIEAGLFRTDLSNDIVNLASTFGLTTVAEASSISTSSSRTLRAATSIVQRSPVPPRSVPLPDTY